MIVEIMQNAEFENIWRYISLVDIKEHWPLIYRMLWSQVDKDFWSWINDIWGGGTLSRRKRPLRLDDKPYFIWWDNRITVRYLHEGIAGDNRYRRIVHMSYILNDAEFEDVWQFLTVNDIQKEFWRIGWRTKGWRDQWKQLLTLLGHPPAEGIDPAWARAHLDEEY